MLERSAEVWLDVSDTSEFFDPCLFGVRRETEIQPEPTKTSRRTDNEGLLWIFAAQLMTAVWNSYAVECPQCFAALRCSS